MTAVQQRADIQTRWEQGSSGGSCVDRTQPWMLPALGPSF